jgi:hypothetical protein
MGQQQTLLIVLAILVIAVAISVGILLFSAQTSQASRDAMLKDMKTIAAEAYVHRTKPGAQGGGNGFYTGFAIPRGLESNPNGTYSVAVSQDSVIIQGTSATEVGSTITAILGPDGKLTAWVYTGRFQ